MTLDLWEQYKIKKPIRLIELFAGYGSQALALKNIGVKFEHHQVVEFDKYAIKTYNALHDTNFKTQDITQLDSLNVTDTDKYEYIMTYSFPCTDLSLAGKQAGMGKGTRSGLLWEVERLLAKSQELPQVLLMENVTQVHGTKFKEDFDKWISFLTNLGYSNIWQDLNAKDYGIPQNRNRTFMVSILGDYDYQFPKPFELKLKLKDMLEHNVDEKYYLSDEMVKFFQKNHNKQQENGNGFKFEPTDGNKVAKAVTTRNGSRMDDNFIVMPEKTKQGYIEAYEGDGVYIDRPHQKRGVVQSEMIQTLTTNSSLLGVVVENKKQKLISRLEKSKKIKPYDVINHSYTNSQQKKESRIEDEDYIESNNGVINTIHTRGDTFGVKTKDLRIRKLTPKECFRLMGLNDYQIDKAYLSGNSNAQLYKQAGNSIVVQVLERIFEGLL